MSYTCDAGHEQDIDQIDAGGLDLGDTALEELDGYGFHADNADNMQAQVRMRVNATVECQEDECDEDVDIICELTCLAFLNDQWVAEEVDDCECESVCPPGTATGVVEQ